MAGDSGARTGSTTFPRTSRGSGGRPIASRAASHRSTGGFHNSALGSAHFHQYQVLPHIVAGFFATLSDPETVVRWSLYLLIVTWPISVYLGARLLDQRRRVAAIAALLSPLLASAPGFGLEWSSYLFRGSGLWTQAFGMWLIPLSIGFTWRAVDRGRGYAPAALLLAATLCCHLFWGYVAVIALGVVVLAGAGKFVRRVGRGALVGVGGLLAVGVAHRAADHRSSLRRPVPAEPARSSTRTARVRSWSG